MDFMSPEELTTIDKQYNIAKVERVLRELKRLQPDANPTTTKSTKPFFGKILKEGEK